jgi:hypothetical protein
VAEGKAGAPDDERREVRFDSVRRNANGILRPLVIVACGYEFAALLPHSRLPTISSMCQRHRWLGPVIVVGLALHLVDMSVNAILPELA